MPHGRYRSCPLSVSRRKNRGGARTLWLIASFESSSALYRDVPGLLRKYYLMSEDRRTGGGVYIFETRADAERVHDEVWRNRLRERMGVEPDVQYFDSPVIVDNEARAATTA